MGLNSAVHQLSFDSTSCWKMETEKCVVKSCQTTSADCHAELRLLRFPEDEKLPLWVEKVKGIGSTWAPQDHSRICSRHFDISCFAARKRSNNLVKSAVPSLSLGVKALYPLASTSGSASESNAMLTTPPCSTSQQFKHPSTFSESNSIKNTKLTVVKRKIGKNVAKKKGLRYNPDTKAKTVSEILKYLNNEEDKEDEFLNRILLRKSVSGLICHVDQLIQEISNPVKEVEFKALGFLLQKIQKNLGLSADEALVVFQQQVPCSVYSSLRSLVYEEKKQYKALIRSFSLSLNFYSVPAYNYVRNMLHDAIPHPRTIQAWYTTIDKYMH